MRRVNEWLDRRSKTLVCLTGLSSIAALVLLDHYTPEQMNFSLFYLLAVAFVAWRAEVWAAGLTVLVATLALSFGEWHASRPELSGWILAWNTCGRLATLAAVVWLVNALVTLNRQLEDRVRSQAAALRQEVAEHERTAEELRESVQRFQQLAENITKVFWLTNTEKSQMVYVSPAYETIWGRSCASLLAAPHSWLEAIHPDDRERVALAARTKQAEGAYDEEYRILRPDGALRWIRDRAFPVRNEQGAVYRLAGIAEDITERRQAEAALKERDEQNRVILSTAMDGFAMVAPDGHITDVNEAFCRITAYSRGELLQMQIADLEAVESAPEVALHIQRVQLQGSDRFEIRLRRKGGEPFHADVSITCPASLGRRFFAVLRDITERKRAEEALRQSEERYRTLAESSPDSIFILDREIRVHYVNPPAAMAWGPVNNVVGRGQADLFPPESARHQSEVVARVFETGEAVRREEFIPFPTGKRWMETRLVPLRDKQGAVKWVMGVGRDVTERKRAEFLLQAQRDIGVSLSLTSDLKAALDRLLDVAVQLEGIDCGGVYLAAPKSGDLTLTAHRGVSPMFAEFSAHHAADDPASRVAKAGRVVYALAKELPNTTDAVWEREGLRAVALLPLQHEGELLGSLNLASHANEEIPAQTRVVIEAIAAQAAGAIARIRTEQALQQSETRLRTVINRAPIALFAADGNGIITFEEGQALRTMDAKPGEHVGRPLEEVYYDFPKLLDCMHRALAGEEFSAVVYVGPAAFETWYAPVRDKDGRAAGCVGVAMNVTERLHLERLILEISDREQARIGQDIHDGLCQQLVSVAFDANSLERQLATHGRAATATARKICALLDEAITETRRVSRGLYPVRLKAEGLAPALEELAASVRERFATPCRCETGDTVLVCDHTTATHLYRIAQEAVNNALKHGRARTISIRLQHSADQVELIVADDGLGMPDPPWHHQGMGLHIMEYRARSIGGTLQVGRSASGGTVVSCCAPCRGK